MSAPQRMSTRLLLLSVNVGLVLLTRCAAFTTQFPSRHGFEAGLGDFVANVGTPTIASENAYSGESFLLLGVNVNGSEAQEVELAFQSPKASADYAYRVSFFFMLTGAFAEPSIQLYATSGVRALLANVTFTAAGLTAQSGFQAWGDFNGATPASKWTQFVLTASTSPVSSVYTITVNGRDAAAFSSHEQLCNTNCLLDALVISQPAVLPSTNPTSWKLDNVWIGPRSIEQVPYEASFSAGDTGGQLSPLPAAQYFPLLHALKLSSTAGEGRTVVAALTQLQPSVVFAVFSHNGGSADGTPQIVLTGDDGITGVVEIEIAHDAVIHAPGSANNVSFPAEASWLAGIARVEVALDWAKGVYSVKINDLRVVFEQAFSNVAPSLTHAEFAVKAQPAGAHVFLTAFALDTGCFGEPPTNGGHLVLTTPCSGTRSGANCDTSCAAGHVDIGNAQCVGTTWNVDNVCYEFSCQNLTDAVGSWTGSFALDTNASLVCPSTHRASSAGSAALQCRGVYTRALWDAKPATCVPWVCPAITGIGVDTTSCAETSVSSQCTPQCLPGYAYRADAPAAFACGATGLWDQAFTANSLCEPSVGDTPLIVFELDSKKLNFYETDERFALDHPLLIQGLDVLQLVDELRAELAATKSELVAFKDWARERHPTTFYDL